MTSQRQRLSPEVCAPAAKPHAGASRARRAGAAGAGAREQRLRTVEVVLAAVICSGRGILGGIGHELRAIGLGWGSGTFGLAQASAASADSPTASASVISELVPKEVRRKLDTGANGVTRSFAANHSVAEALGSI